MLGIVEITADGVAKIGGQEGETTLTVVYYAFAEKGTHENNNKNTHHQSFVVQKSLHLLYKSKPFQYEHSSTFASLVTTIFTIAPTSTSNP